MGLWQLLARALRLAAPAVLAIVMLLALAVLVADVFGLVQVVPE